jgi:hypothetical protein
MRRAATMTAAVAGLPEGSTERAFRPSQRRLAEDLSIGVPLMQRFGAGREGRHTGHVMFLLLSVLASDELQASMVSAWVSAGVRETWEQEKASHRLRLIRAACDRRDEVLRAWTKHAEGMLVPSCVAALGRAR